MVYNIIAKVCQCWVIERVLDDTWGIVDVAHIAESRGTSHRSVVDFPTSKRSNYWSRAYLWYSLVSRPRPAFRCFQSTESDGKLGGAWERGYFWYLQSFRTGQLNCFFPQYVLRAFVFPARVPPRGCTHRLRLCAHYRYFHDWLVMEFCCCVLAVCSIIDLSSCPENTSLASRPSIAPVINPFCSDHEMEPCWVGL